MSHLYVVDAGGDLPEPPIGGGAPASPNPNPNPDPGPVDLVDL